MYTKILEPEIMASMLPDDFGGEAEPASVQDGRGPRRHGGGPRRRAHRGGRVPARRTRRVPPTVSRPRRTTGPGLPALGAHVHMRETNDFEYFVSRAMRTCTWTCAAPQVRRGPVAALLADEQRDLYDVIEWIAAQPWCTGKVGMIGESYPGIVQWFAAAQQPPHLACIVPYDAVSDAYRRTSTTEARWPWVLWGVGHTTEILGTIGWVAKQKTPVLETGISPGT